MLAIVNCPELGERREPTHLYVLNILQIARISGFVCLCALVLLNEQLCVLLARHKQAFVHCSYAACLKGSCNRAWCLLLSWQLTFPLRLYHGTEKGIGK